MKAQGNSVENMLFNSYHSGETKENPKQTLNQKQKTKTKVPLTS